LLNAAGLGVDEFSIGFQIDGVTVLVGKVADDNGIVK